MASNAGTVAGALGLAAAGFVLIGAFLPYVTAGESRSLSVNLWDVLSSSDVAGGGLRGAVLVILASVLVLLAGCTMSFSGLVAPGGLVVLFGGALTLIGYGAFVLVFHDLTRDLSLLDDSGFAGSGHWVDVAGIGSYLVALGSVLAVAGGIFAATSQPATR